MKKSCCPNDKILRTKDFLKMVITQIQLRSNADQLDMQICSKHIHSNNEKINRLIDFAYR
jgi:hypothetical protein